MDAATVDKAPTTGTRRIADVLAESQVEAVLQELERDLVGLAPVKARIRDIAALLVIDKLRINLGLTSQAPSLHMSFTGNPGTGKTTVARLLAEMYRAVGLLQKGHLVEVDRAGLVGQYVGETALKTDRVIRRALDASARAVPAGAARLTASPLCAVAGRGPHRAVGGTDAAPVLRLGPLLTLRLLQRSHLLS